MTPSSPPLRVRVDTNPWAIVILRDDQPIMRWSAKTLAVVQVRSVKVRRFIAWDFFFDQGVKRIPLTTILSDTTVGDERTWELGHDSEIPLARLRLNRIAHDHWSFTLDLCQAQHSRLVWGWESLQIEQLAGFGQRSHAIKTRARFDTWVEEGAVGLGPLSRWLRWTGRIPIPKGGYTSPAPLSWWLSDQGYVAWLTTSHLVRFQRWPTRVSATIWARSVTGHIISAKTPLAGLEASSALIGRPELPLPWIFAPWNDSVRGQDEAEALADFLRDQRIPSAVIWIEDWTGSQENTRRFWMRPLSHQCDRDLYPDLEGLATRLHQSGFRLLGYVCPEITYGTELYEEARRGGHLVTDAHGRPVHVSILGIRHGEWDLSQPATQAFIQQRLFEPAYRLGFDGWMADFGEYLPVHSRLSDGSDGWQSHNTYPLWWQTVNQAFWRAKRPNGDFAYFTRSATLGSQSRVQVMWGGDSDTDFDPADGLASVIPQLLSASLSGFPFWGTDIAGYMTFGLTAPSTRELFWRWLQLGALVPIMRTHHGTARPRNWHFRRDDATVLQYARYARLHTALGPYWYALAEAASTKGWPIARALFLHYPEFAEAWNCQDQFLIGEHVLVAPVTKPHSHRRRLWLPPGVWRHWWQGTSWRGPAVIEIAAPPDELPLFVRRESILPLFEGARIPDDAAAEAFQLDGLIDTLTVADGLTDWMKANAIVTLLVSNPTLPLKCQLGDHTTLQIEPVDAHVPLTLTARPAPPPLVRTHLPSYTEMGTAVYLSPGMSAVLPCDTHRVRLSVLSGPSRWYVVRPG